MSNSRINSSSFLRTEFLRDAKVIDSKKGYISVSSFNLRMKPAVLAAAAQVIVAEFAHESLNALHGIPHSGNYLATAVSLEYARSSVGTLQSDLRLHASRKDFSVPTSWKDIYRREVQSFTTSSGGLDVFSGITLSFARKGDRILLLDDVCATGETATRIITGLQDKGLEVVGFAVLFDKVFQGGLARVEKMGVKTFSCVRVKEVGSEDKVILE